VICKLCLFYSPATQKIVGDRVDRDDRKFRGRGFYIGYVIYWMEDIYIYVYISIYILKILSSLSSIKIYI